MALIPLRPDSRSPADAPPAYAVPWRVERVSTHPVVTNDGDETLRFVRALLSDGSGRTAHETWGTLLPGESSEVCLCGFDASDCFVTLAWFRGEEEFLWRFVL